MAVIVNSNNMVLGNKVVVVPGLWILDIILTVQPSYTQLIRVFTVALSVSKCLLKGTLFLIFEYFIAKMNA